VTADQKRLCLGLRGFHRKNSPARTLPSQRAESKRRVVAEYHGSETLHALGRRHDPSRYLIRIWLENTEAGALEIGF
jgi:hypothetical protein